MKLALPKFFATAHTMAEYSTLLSLIETSDLLEELGKQDTYTFFAPTNEAFAKLPRDKYELLTDPDNIERLTEVLLYHIIPHKKILIKNLKDRAVINMANGDTAMVNLAHSIQLVFPRGSTTIIEADIDSGTCIIHGINTVLMPK